MRKKQTCKRPSLTELLCIFYRHPNVSMQEPRAAVLAFCVKLGPTRQDQVSMRAYFKFLAL
jgi:hypothetical protein